MKNTPQNLKNFSFLLIVMTSLSVTSFRSVNAADFTVTAGPSVGTQTLTAGETGTVEASGTIFDIGTFGSAGGMFGINGGDASGVNISGAGTTLNNNGTFDVRGNSGGSIGGLGSVAGDGGDGIAINSSSDNSAITNNGTITVSGGEGGGANGGISDGDAGTATGIIVSGNNNKIINNGVITATGGERVVRVGNGALGLGKPIIITGTGNEIINNGTIQAINGSGNIGTKTAFQIDGNNTTVSLGKNSQITGDVVFGGGVTGGVVKYTIVNEFPNEGGGFSEKSPAPTLANFSGTYTVQASEDFAQAPDGAVIVQVGPRALAVTPDIYATSDQVIINQTAQQAVQLVAQRQQIAQINNDFMVANNPEALNNVTPAAGGENINHTENELWVEGFGSYLERPEDGNASFSRTKSGGALTGIDFKNPSGNITMGIFVGGFAGEHIMGRNTFRTIESNGALVGGYVSGNYNDYTLTGQLSGGYNQNDSERIVGNEIATADYNSFFISPAIAIARPIEPIPGGALLVPSITLHYTGQHSDSYKEKGSVADQDVESRNYHSVGTRLQLDSHIHHDMQKRLKTVIRMGVDAQKEISSDDVNLSVAGSRVTLDPQGGEKSIDGFVGFNTAYNINQKFKLELDNEVFVGLNGKDINDNFGITSKLKAVWKLGSK